MFEGLERISFSPNWVTFTLIFVLILITVLKIKSEERFSKLFTLFYSEIYYGTYTKTKSLFLSKFHIISFLIIIINLSFLIFNSAKIFLLLKTPSNLTVFLQICFGVISYLFLRYFLGFFIAFILDISESQKRITFLKISNLLLISITIYPFLVLINYSTGLFQKTLVILSLIISAILLFLRYYFLIKSERNNFSNLFYLLLYLCALEIAPFIVLYKMFVD